MSVSYSAKFGYGFIVNKNEIEMLNDEQHDNFIDSEFAHILDGYADKSDYFFGLTLISLDEGTAQVVPTERQYDHNKFMAMIQEFKTYFPNQNSYIPRDCVFFSIN